MPLIDKAWKVNVNVWKKQLTLQSVFNRGECMVHVDKNVDGHVLDVDRISKEIAYVPLNGRIRSKHSSCMQNFFFFLMSTWYAYLEDNGFGLWLMLSEDQRFWILTHVFRGLGFLDLGSCFQRTKGFEVLAHVFRGPKVLDPGSCSQRPRIFRSWLMFSEDQGSGSWLMFSET